MRYFIADMHFVDENINTYFHRPYLNGLKMDQYMIEQWNKIIKNDKDDIYILGDIGNYNILNKLNGNKYIICGNHDSYENLVEFSKENKKSNIIRIYDTTIVIGNYILSHEPILFIPKECPYLNLHGHIHNFDYGYGLTWAEGLRHFNVGADKIRFSPISEQEICDCIQYRKNGDYN